MSVYTISSDKSIFNLPKALGSVDINTRNEYFGTIVGFEAGGTNPTGAYNAIFGYRAASLLTSGANNVFIGAQAAANVTSASDNLVIGTSAGKFLLTGTRNVILGNNSGYYLNGNQNILIGFNNTSTNDDSSSSCNISIGYRSSVFGLNNASMGNDNYAYSLGSIIVGSSVHDESTNSIILGNNIYNKGSNVLILNNRHNSNGIALSNTSNNYVNINDILLVYYDSNNKPQTTLVGDTIKLSGCNINITTQDTSILFSDIITLKGKYSSLTLGPEILLSPSNSSNPYAPNLYLTSNAAFLGSSNQLASVVVMNSNTSLIMSSNDVRLAGSNYYLSMDPRFLSLGLLNSNALTMSNGVNTFQGSVSLCNNFIVNGSATFNSNIAGQSVYLTNTLTASNTTINGNLSVSGVSIFSNNIISSGTFYGNSLTSSNLVTSTATVSNGANIYGNLYSFGPTHLYEGLTGTSAVFSSNVQGQNLLINNNLSVGNEAYFTNKVYLQSDTIIYGVTTFSNDVNITGAVHFLGDVLFDGAAKFTNIEADTFTGRYATFSENLQTSNATIQGELATYGTAYFYSNIIGQSAYFSSNVETSNLTVDGKLSTYGPSYFYSNIIGVTATFSSNLKTSNLTVDGVSKTFGTTYFYSNIVGQSAVFSNVQASNIRSTGDLTVYGNTTLCNSLKIHGTTYGSTGTFQTIYASNANLSNTTISGPLLVNNIATFGSNITLNPNVSIVNTGDLYITGGGLNIDERTLIKDLVIYGSITLCNGAMASNLATGNGSNSSGSNSTGGNGGGGNIVFPPGSSNITMLSNFPQGHFTADFVKGDPLVEFEDTLLVHHDVYVCSNIYALGAISASQVVAQQAAFGNTLVQGALVVNGELTLPGGTSLGSNLVAGSGLSSPLVNYTSNNFTYWTETIDVQEPGVSGDLIFQSRNGAVVTFTDDFHPEVLNFTGKHRCVYSTSDKTRNTEEDEMIGKLVIATGRYRNLQDDNSPELDEAIPVVTLCTKANDKRVFGVFAGFEEKGEFHVGNITFRTKYNQSKRAIIQSVGEGCMWVCNFNGRIRNGDFLCSSPIAGYAMRQDSDLLLNSTVAKSTCRCSFVSKETRVVRHKGKRYKCAFIGVTYKM